MPESNLAKCLAIKPGPIVAVVNAPDGSTAFLGELPQGAVVREAGAGEADVVIAFARDQAQLASFAAPAFAALKTDSVIWFAYPKRSSKIRTDLNRDKGWATVLDAGYDPVSQVALDETRSALRFKNDPRLRAEPAARRARVGGT